MRALAIRAVDGRELSNSVYMKTATHEANQHVPSMFFRTIKGSQKLER
jgi:hypothetical protein